ncbi:MAG: hypothetical protein V8S74_06080 [Lachnospirales bacterium]
MNYDVFMKAELIEAITKSGAKSWDIDFELLKILDKKIGAVLNQIKEVNNNIIIALQKKDINKYCELTKKMEILEKKLQRLYKA